MTRIKPRPDYEKISGNLVRELDNVLNWFKEGSPEYDSVYELFHKATLALASSCHPQSHSYPTTAQEELKIARATAEMLEELEETLRQVHNIQDCPALSEAANKLKEWAGEFEKSCSHHGSHR